MENKGKAAVAILGLGALGGLIYACTRPARGEGEGGLSMELYDQYGNRIAGNARDIGVLPASVVEGTVLLAILKVTNTSYKVVGTTNVPQAANLWLSFNAYAAGAPGDAQIIWAPYAEKQFSFAAGETKTITATEWPALQFTVSLGTNGTVVAVLRDPSKTIILGSVSVALTITAAAIVYGGTIIFI